MKAESILDGERIDTVNENIRLIQKKNGLTFGSDVFLLSAYVRPSKNAVCADLGSGTGIAAFLCLARNKCKKVHAVEIQPDFAELISRNAELNGFSDRVEVHCADVRQLTAAQLGGEVDIVISNPPYMRTDSGKRNVADEKYIARHEVCGNVYDFCAAAGRILKFGGRFFCVWRPDRTADLIDAMRKASLEPKRMTFVHSDVSSEPSVLLVEAVKGGAGSVRVTAPLIIYRDGADISPRRMTPQAQNIYDSGSFDFEKQFPQKRKKDME